MTVRRPNNTQNRYDVSMKYLCQRLGIELNDNTKVSSIRVSENDDGYVNKLAIWTEEEFDDPNYHR